MPSSSFSAMLPQNTLQDAITSLISIGVQGGRAPMVAKLRRAHLRDCARKALERRGYSVKDISRMGVAPGAQLRISKGSETYRVAVRSSLERKVGIVRK